MIVTASNTPSVPESAPLTDSFGRKIEYLRISVTDRCNLRCVYCMPMEGLPWLPKPDILSIDEITEIVRQLSPFGLKKIRISGGEPTLRPDLVSLVGMLRAIPHVEEISLSTNGVRFTAMADELRNAGLDRVNISVDALSLEIASRMARRRITESPLLAVEKAHEVGLSPIKINVVLVKGLNDGEVVEFAKLVLDRPLHIRFIELMPAGDLQALTFDHIVEKSEVLDRISILGDWVPVEQAIQGNGPAKYYHIPGSVGSIGFITPMSHTYCASCNRVRLTADGRLRTCLFGDHEVLLRESLRRGESLDGLFRQALRDKPREHGLLQMKTGGLKALSQVGG